MALVLAASPAAADLSLCNRTSYVIDAAIAIEEKSNAASRGWFRVDPGQCRTVMQGHVEADRIFVHARALPLYGAAPLALSDHADFCIADGNFLIAGARDCAGAGERLARFTAVKPAETGQGLVATLAEEADYSAEQARLAAIQRLLVLAGYDVNPIDGIEGRKTEAALAQFLKDRGLAADAAAGTAIFDVLIATARDVAGTGGFAWCNETRHPVMAALGITDGATVVTRGWYRIEPGQCLRPQPAEKARRLFSFAEAVDGEGRALTRAGRPLAWGGETILCTRETRFELTEHRDCAGAGLIPRGFAAIDVAAGAPVRLRE